MNTRSFSLIKPTGSRRDLPLKSSNSFFRTAQILNQKNDIGCTALLITAKHGNTELVKLLISLRADIKAK